jgi:hypothetical protein
MKARNVHKLILTLELWRGGACGPGEVATCLGWPYQKAQTIFETIGIANIDNTITSNLTNEQILITLLWYQVNALAKQLEGGKHEERTHP